MTSTKKSRISADQLLKVVLFSLMVVAKYLRLPPRLFPGHFRLIMQHWSLPMLKLYVKSGATRVYMDQPCALPDPPTFEPAVQVADERYRLTADDIRTFYEQGFLGPFTAVSEQEMAVLAQALEAELEKPSQAFGFHTVRDRHLDLPALSDLFSRPAIVERLAQLLGPDLLIWRSQVFNQEPGAPLIAWHQASTYMLEDYQRPILEPEDKDQLFQLTTWIAVDEATIENGCLQFVPGTHRTINTLKIGGDETFYEQRFKLEYEVDPSQVVSMELKAGQFVIFTERVIHGSPGNRSSRRRMGINFRTITPRTRVYHGQDEHYAMHLDKTYKLSNWGVYLLRGQDRYELNKVFKGFERKHLTP